MVVLRLIASALVTVPTLLFFKLDSIKGRFLSFLIAIIFMIFVLRLPKPSE